MDFMFLFCGCCLFVSEVFILVEPNRKWLKKKHRARYGTAVGGNMELIDSYDNNK